MDSTNVPVNIGRPEQPNVQQTQQKSNKRKKLFLIAAAIIAAIIIGVGVAATLNNKQASSYVDKSKYQAVFLSNGQTYFGKLSLINDQYVKLNDIYYLQLSENLQQTASTDGKKEDESAVAGAQSEPQLIKLGQEIHGPDDEMILNKDQVLFWENLKQDGTLTKTIKDYAQKQGAKE